MVIEATIDIAKNATRDYFAPIRAIHEFALEMTTRRWAAQERAITRNARDIVVEDFVQIDGLFSKAEASKEEVPKDDCEAVMSNLCDDFYGLYVVDRDQKFDDVSRKKMAASVDRVVAGCGWKSIDEDELYAVALFVPEAADLIRKHADKFDHVDDAVLSRFSEITPEEDASKQVISSGGRYFFGPRFGANKDRQWAYPMAYIEKTRSRTTDEVKIVDYYCIEDASDESREGINREVDLSCEVYKDDAPDKALAKMATHRRMEVFLHTAEMFFADKITPKAKVEAPSVL